MALEVSTAGAGAHGDTGQWPQRGKGQGHFLNPAKAQVTIFRFRIFAMVQMRTGGSGFYTEESLRPSVYSEENEVVLQQI